MNILDSLPARGRRAASPLGIEVVRPLTESDLVAAPQAQAPAQALANVRSTHHRLAQLLASGTVKNEEASRITGYSTSRISILKSDPAFKELMAHYAAVAEEKFVDVQQRMADLGLHSLEELQAQLDEEPEAWSKRELMELAELMLIKPAQARAQAQSGARTAVAVQVQFVRAPGATIEGTAETVESD